jgi:hypothetical protein
MGESFEARRTTAGCGTGSRDDGKVSTHSIVCMLMRINGIVFRLLLDESLTPNERFFVSKMIYGAQTDKFDYHYVSRCHF